MQNIYLFFQSINKFEKVGNDKCGGVKMHNVEDTIKLLKECNAGSKTAVNSINQVIGDVNSKKFEDLLTTNISRHEQIGNETHRMLKEHGEQDKDPNIMARSMTWMTTNMKLMADDSDHEIASLMIDGCNMGIKKVSEYVNKYQNASSESVDIATKLIETEQKFMDDLRLYL